MTNYLDDAQLSHSIFHFNEHASDYLPQFGKYFLLMTFRDYLHIAQ